MSKTKIKNWWLVVVDLDGGYAVFKAKYCQRKFYSGGDRWDFKGSLDSFAVAETEAGEFEIRHSFKWHVQDWADDKVINAITKAKGGDQ